MKFPPSLSLYLSISLSLSLSLLFPLYIRYSGRRASPSDNLITIFQQIFLEEGDAFGALLPNTDADIGNRGSNASSLTNLEYPNL